MPQITGEVVRSSVEDERVEFTFSVPAFTERTVERRVKRNMKRKGYDGVEVVSVEKNVPTDLPGQYTYIVEATAPR